VYEELRKLAAGHMANEAPGHSLDATALVHEAYVRLVAAFSQSNRRRRVVVEEPKCIKGPQRSTFQKASTFRTSSRGKCVNVESASMFLNRVFFRLRFSSAIDGVKGAVPDGRRFGRSGAGQLKWIPLWNHARPYRP